MGKKYENWNELFCDELCEEIGKFEECPTMERLKKVKDLVEVINGLQEMEMAGAIRSLAEDYYGYDSGTGRFRSVGECGGYDAQIEFLEMFNAARGGSSRGSRRRRDSRGRFMANMAGPKPTVYYPPEPDGYPYEYPYYMMNDGREKSRSTDGGRREYSGNSRAYPNGSDIDDGMYMLRQQNGRPIMTPYNMAHEIPKKLTDQQCDEWMKNLVNFDGTDGAHWTKPQVEAEAKRAGIDISKFGLPLIAAVTNAMYADYGDIARMYNADKPSFYIRMAEAFLNDEDFSGTPQEKASLYFHQIVEHE